MRTSIEIPDPLFRQLKIRAAELGVPMRELLIRGAERELEQARPEKGQEAWRKFYGMFADDKDEIDSIQARIDEEFEPIDPDEWK